MGKGEGNTLSFHEVFRNWEKSYLVILSPVNFGGREQEKSSESRTVLERDDEKRTTMGK